MRTVKELLQLMDKQSVKETAKKIAINAGLDWHNVDFDKMYARWKDCLELLTDKELKVILLRQKGMTLEAVGKEFGVTRERIRQIEAKAKEKIRSKLSQ